MYRIAICDDELNTRENLKAMCCKLLNEMQIEHEIVQFSASEELEEALSRGEQFNLLCLDILCRTKAEWSSPGRYASMTIM